MKLDESRSYGEIRGSQDQGKFEQDGLIFDGMKNLVGELPEGWAPSTEQAQTEDGRTVVVGPHPDEEALLALKATLEARESRLSDMEEELEERRLGLDKLSGELQAMRLELDERKAAIETREKAAATVPEAAEPEEEVDPALVCAFCKDNGVEYSAKSSRGLASHIRAKHSVAGESA